MIHFGDIFTSLQYDLVHSGILYSVLQILITLSPIILLLVLWMIFWPLWVNYVRSSFIFSTKKAVLEIRLPKEMMKSPLAMEIFLGSLHNTSDGSNFAQYWKGEFRPNVSLELASIDGVVRFFLWLEDGRKHAIIGALYSQFPGIEVHEVEDYTKNIFYDPKVMKLWGGEFIFTKPDPYPIKTYVDYGLDKDPKEEFKVDPLTPTIELLGNLPPNQQIWIQYMLRAHKDDQRKPGHFMKKTDLWKDKALEEVNRIMMRDPKTKVAGMKDEATGFTKLPSISKGEQDIVEAIERSIRKPAFDVVIRTIYFAPKEVFDKKNGMGGIISSFKHYSTEHLNGFKPDGSKWPAKFKGSPWEDYKNMRLNRQCRLVLEAYKRRCGFYDPFKSKPLVLNIEELATMYHFPGQVAATPSLNRVPSKKFEAPANLPI
jgi:hypothetical protein